MSPQLGDNFGPDGQQGATELRVGGVVCACGMCLNISTSRGHVEYGARELQTPMTWAPVLVISVLIATL